MLNVAAAPAVYYQDNFVQKLRWRSVDDRVDRPEEGAPALVVEHQDDGGLGEIVGVVPVLTFLLSVVKVNQLFSSSLTSRFTLQSLTLPVPGKPFAAEFIICK